MAPCATVKSGGEGNPLMALVDAAASLLDENKAKQPVTESASISGTECSRPSTPASESVSLDSVSIERGALNDRKISFAELLMRVLDDDSCDVLTWMPDGKSFTIVNPKKFTRVEMPRIFNIRNMSSFVRKLTRWGFSRVHEKETMNSDIFKHENFQQGKPELCSKIKCIGRNTPGPSPIIGKKLAIPTRALAGTPVPPPPSSSFPSAPVTPVTRETPSPMPPAGLNPAGLKTISYLQENVRPSPQTQRTVVQPAVSTSVLNATLESLRRQSEPVLDILALQRLLDASRQQSALTTQVQAWQQARNDNIYANLASWGGLPPQLL